MNDVIKVMVRIFIDLEMNSNIPTLYPYQVIGVQFLISHSKVLLADEMGLGKTVETIAAFKSLNPKGQVLIVCPNSMKLTWQREVMKWYPEAQAQVIEGSRIARLEQLQSAVTYFIINYEAVRLHQKELTRHWSICILDETHRVKNRKAQVTKVIRSITRSIPRVIELTGTPIINRASELFSLLQILFPQTYTSYWRFCEQYCNIYFNGFGYVVGDILNPADRRIIRLREILSGFMLRRTKMQVAKSLPAKTIQQIPVVLSLEHYKLYHQMETEMMVYLSQQEVVRAPTVLSLITRLRQMAIDPTIMLQDETKSLTGSKIDAVKDLVEGAGDEKVVIFSQFARVIHRLRLNLSEWEIPFTGFTGQTSVKEREAALQMFQEDPQVKVFLTTIGAGGQGITLSAGSIAIFIDKAWAPAYNTQAQDRLHRISQEHPVTIYELIAQNTVEERIEKLLRHKGRISDLLIEDSFKQLFTAYDI